MWAVWVIRDVSTRGKASEHAAAKSYWMNGWENQNGLTKGLQKSAPTRAEELLQIATMLIDEHCPPAYFFCNTAICAASSRFLWVMACSARSHGKVSRGLLRRTSCNSLRSARLNRGGVPK